MLRHVGCVLLTCAVLVAPAAAEQPLHAALGAPSALTLSGSFRMRAEAIDGQYRANVASSDSMISLRTTVLADYGTGPLHIGAQLWDARAYGQAVNSSAGTGEVNALELVQAYLALDMGEALGEEGHSLLTAGRFTLNIGSRRLISRQNFRNTTNAFTGVKIEWSGTNGNYATAFWAMPQRRLPNDPASIRDNKVVFDHESTDLQLFGASMSRGGVLGGSIEFYGYGLLERDSPAVATTNRRLFTPGVRLFVAPHIGNFDHDFEFTYQRGTAHATFSASDTQPLKVRAWFLHAEIGHSFDAPLAPRIALQYDHASGGGANPATLNRFDSLFGARRGDFGPTSLYGAIARANVISPAVRVEVTPSPRLDAVVAWRPVWLAGARGNFGNSVVIDPSGNAGRFVGHQIEARLRYWLIPGLARLDTGVALLAKGRFLRDAPNAPATGDTHYGYCDLSFEF